MAVITDQRSGRSRAMSDRNGRVEQSKRETLSPARDPAH
jgi:hypothetical protein